METKTIGLTGGIATGKSFVANIFSNHKVKIFYSDLEVSKLLKKQEVIDSIKQNSSLVEAVEENVINKDKLSKIVFNENSENLKNLEDILLPKVREEIAKFIKENKSERIILLEIPLLFEKNYQSICHKVIVTHCEHELQEYRALSRNNIDKKRLSFIIKRQIAANVKASLADYIVYTGISESYSQKQVEQIILKESIE